MLISRKNKKRIFWLLFWVGVLVVVFFVFDSGANKKINVVNENKIQEKVLEITEDELVKKLKSAIIKTEYGSISLKDGEANFDNGLEGGYVVVGDVFDYKIVNQNGKDNIFAYSFYAINFGGSGLFYYLAEFKFGENGFVSDKSYFLADRIKVKKIEIKSIDNLSKKVEVTFLDHSEKESFAESPSVSVLRVFDF